MSESEKPTTTEKPAQAKSTKKPKWGAHQYVEFSEDRGRFKKGSVHRLDGDLARHFVTVDEIAKVVPKPKALDRKEASAGGGLTTKDAPRG